MALITYQYDWYEDVTRIGGAVQPSVLPGEVPIKLVHEHYNEIVIEVIKVTPPAWPALPDVEEA